MPDEFELAQAALGLDPMVADNNGDQLSIAFTGVAGYSNLECYLNTLADQRLLPDTLFQSGFE